MLSTNQPNPQHTGNGSLLFGDVRVPGALLRCEQAPRPCRAVRFAPDGQHAVCGSRILSVASGLCPSLSFVCFSFWATCYVHLLFALHCFFARKTLSRDFLSF